MCGEKCKSSSSTVTFRGSPPRVRGKARLTLLLHQLHGITPRVRGKAIVASFIRYSFRITPACAGKSILFHRRPLYTRDHPRVCGEKFQSCHGSHVSLGSPPRVRGKVVAVVFGGKLDGITPACAGKSDRRVVTLPAVEDHPRVCGEKSAS